MLVKTQQFGFRSLITGVYIVHWHNLAGSVIMTKCALLLTNFRRVSLCLTVRAFLPGLETLFCRGYAPSAAQNYGTAVTVFPDFVYSSVGNVIHACPVCVATAFCGPFQVLLPLSFKRTPRSDDGRKHAHTLFDHHFLRT